MLISRLVEDALARRAREHRVSSILVRLLQVLGDRAPTMNELAELLGLDKSSTSGLVDRAQRRGLVRRVPSQRDRRSVRVRLTTDGRELLHQVEESFARDLSALLAPLPSEANQTLAESLSRVLAARRIGNVDP